jgi:ADP-ribose pyrophosphatase YjhB (NUDIX family)
VGAVVHDDTGRLLVVRRGQPPSQGKWSIPGGRVELGESDAEAVRREVLEETGLDVTVGMLLGTVERSAVADGDVYDIRDYACALMGGRLRAGDDAADVRFVGRGELMLLDLTEGLLDSLELWGVLPSR